jgi:TP901 family phage tail tape measure protein
MALVKISGGDTESAVQSLTAAINTFKGELLDTTTILNKVTNVDAAYAVSARDLTESIKRAGATAQDAKVSFNELIAATAALQQSTARGGSVIGNSLKSIFTRVTRTDTLDLLDDLGVKTRSLEGEVRPAIEILKELSSVFNTLSDSQKSQVKESVAGVYQINALSALLADLSSKTSTYDGALAKANETTDSASARLKV